MYMPTTLPGLSITKAAELLQMQDRIIKSFPEVASVYARRACLDRDRSGSDGNVRDVINLKPKSEWRPGLTIDALKTRWIRRSSSQASPMRGPWAMPIRPGSTCFRPESARRWA